MTRRVFNQMGPGVEPFVHAVDPDIEIVTLAHDDTAPDPSVEILYGGWDANEGALAAMRAGGLKWVHLGAVGAEKLPPDVFDGPVITCGRGVAGAPIAEFAVASMLAFVKRFPDIWVTEPTSPVAIPLTEMSTATVGIIGLGDIGQQAARRLLPFGTRVRAFRRTGAPSPIDGVEIVTELDDLLGSADHVLIACPLTDETRQMIDADAFSAMKDGVHLVNIARGEIVDQDALHDALESGKVALASLDVTTPEPLPVGHWMYEHPRVHVSPHSSWSNPDHMDRAHASFARNLARYLADEDLFDVVQREAGY